MSYRRRVLLATAWVWFLVSGFLALAHTPPLLAFFPGFLFIIPPLLGIPLALCFKDNATLFSWLLALLFSVAGLLPWYANSSSAGPGSFSLLSWNINAWQTDLNAIADFLKQRDDDVICLQEMHKGPPDKDPRPLIRNNLKGYTWLQGYNSHRNDLAILSKMPIEKLEDYALDQAYALLARIQTDAGPVKLLVVHLHRHPGNFPRMDDGEQWRRLRGVIDGIEGPLVVAGDFNAPPRSAAIANLSEVLQDTFALRGRGFGYTFPAALPCLRLDYIFCRQLAPLSIEIPQTNLSDHLPVSTRLAQTPRTP